MLGQNETFSRDVRLAVTLPNKIEQNTNVLLKLNVHCTSLRHSLFGVVPVSIVAPPRTLKLEVCFLFFKYYIIIKLNKLDQLLN